MAKAGVPIHEPDEEQERPRGLRCPRCHCGHLDRVYKTDKQTCNRIRRVRICRNCGHRSITYEKVE